MELLMDRSEICYYASKYDDNDKPVERLVDDVKGKCYLGKADLLTLSRWKATKRNSHNIKKNEDRVVEELTGFALKAKTEKARIDVLYCLHGVRLPVASAILHWFHDDCYPIYDWRALETVGVKKETNTPPFDEWIRYVSFCRRTAKENEITMRELDRALWQYSREQSKKRGR